MNSVRVAPQAGVPTKDHPEGGFASSGAPVMGFVE